MSGRHQEKRLTFGAWLLQQKSQEGWVGDLIAAAKRDPLFSKNGDPEAVRARLRDLQAEGDMFQAVDGAELDWMSS